MELGKMVYGIYHILIKEGIPIYEQSRITNS